MRPIDSRTTFEPAYGRRFNKHWFSEIVCSKWNQIIRVLRQWRFWLELTLAERMVLEWSPQLRKGTDSPKHEEVLKKVDEHLLDSYYSFLKHPAGRIVSQLRNGADDHAEAKRMRISRFCSVSLSPLHGEVQSCLDCSQFAHPAELGSGRRLQ